MTLLDDGWTEEHAKGILDALELAGGVPNWKSEHLQRLYKWCAAHQRDHGAVEDQLEFVACDLCNDYQAVGLALKRATSVDEARAAVKPYVRALNAHHTANNRGSFDDRKTERPRRVPTRHQTASSIVSRPGAQLFSPPRLAVD